MANHAKIAAAMRMSRPLMRDQVDGTAGTFPARPAASAAIAEADVDLPQAGQVTGPPPGPGSASNVCPQSTQTCFMG